MFVITSSVKIEKLIEIDRKSIDRESFVTNLDNEVEWICMKSNVLKKNIKDSISLDITYYASVYKEPLYVYIMTEKYFRDVFRFEIFKLRKVGILGTENDREKIKIVNKDERICNESKLTNIIKESLENNFKVNSIVSFELK